jgi:catechol 2,3-dioxygenase-like lactoylglutathione lyase family enzyme
MIKKATPILPSLNEAETIQFYTEKLGFTFVFNNNGYLIFVRDGINVHLWPCTDPAQAINCGFYLYVTDIEDIYAEYKAHNLIHPNGDLSQKAWGRQFAVVDNNGNIIYLADYREG